MYAGPDGDPTAAICARVPSDRKAGAAGYLHRLRDDGRGADRVRRRVVTFDARDDAGREDFDVLAQRCANAANPLAVAGLADELGLSIGSVRRLGIGWSAKHGAWTFPMRSADGNVAGIRLRLPDGRKLSVKGGREGLFVPDGLTGDGPLLVAEGPTDTAALLDLGFDAIGRPSCNGGVRHVVELVRSRGVANVVIAADADAPGQRGANDLADVLAVYVPLVRVLSPIGAKDAREWKRKGATHNDIYEAIQVYEPRRLTIRSTRRGR